MPPSCHVSTQLHWWALPLWFSGSPPKTHRARSQDPTWLLCRWLRGSQSQLDAGKEPAPRTPDLPAKISCPVLRRLNTAAMQPPQSFIFHSREAAAWHPGHLFCPLAFPFHVSPPALFSFSLTCNLWFSYLQGKVQIFRRTTRNHCILQGTVQIKSQVRDPWAPTVPVLVALVTPKGTGLMLHCQKLPSCLLWDSILLGCSKVQEVDLPKPGCGIKAKWQLSAKSQTPNSQSNLTLTHPPARFRSPAVAAERHLIVWHVMMDGSPAGLFEAMVFTELLCKDTYAFTLQLA